MTSAPKVVWLRLAKAGVLHYQGKTMFDFQIQNREDADVDKGLADRRSISSSHARQVAVHDEHGQVAGWVIAPVCRDVFGRERGTVFMDRP